MSEPYKEIEHIINMKFDRLKSILGGAELFTTLGFDFLNEFSFDDFQIEQLTLNKNKIHYGKLIYWDIEENITLGVAVSYENLVFIEMYGFTNNIMEKSYSAGSLEPKKRIDLNIAKNIGKQLKEFSEEDVNTLLNLYRILKESD